MDEINQKQRKKSKFEIKFWGYSIWRITAYFIIYSIGGYLTETLFGILTKGVLESRQSMLYGPFCCIYGIGAITLICMPKQLKKTKWTLFWSGVIYGSIVEYLVSWIGDCYFHMKWWDYSNLAFNINGRICLIFSIFWGLLAICLNRVINPIVDKWINKMPEKLLKITVAIIFAFLVIDVIISSFALKMFFTRLIHNYHLGVIGPDSYYQQYLDMYQNNEKIKNIVDKYFSDKKMIEIFPNVKVTLKDGNVILVRDILKDIKPYYLRIFTPKNIGNIDLLTDY